MSAAALLPRARHRHRLTGLAAAFALLWIALAPLWHHHDGHDCDDHGPAQDQQSCAICAAVLTPSAPGPAPTVIAAPATVGIAEPDIWTAPPSLRIAGLPPVRGPPAL